VPPARRPRDDARLAVGSAGPRTHDLSPVIHLYLFDRYSRLAWYHERRGHRQRALRLRARAAEHWRHAGHDGPPFAVALTMPVPRPPPLTRAVATRRLRSPDDAA
jgi:hypothetical protein